DADFQDDRMPEHIGYNVLDGVVGMERLSEILSNLEDVKSIFIRAPIEVQLSKAETDQVCFWDVMCNDAVRLRESALNAVEDENILDKAERVDKGGWLPIAIPRGFYYATNLKNPKPLTYIMDG